jgi:hypothetical protein
MDAGTMKVICECGKLGCAQQITISIDEYERIRSDATLFIVVPGHGTPDVEVVVEQRDEFTIVRKDKRRDARSRSRPIRGDRARGPRRRARCSGVSGDREPLRPGAPIPTRPPRTSPQSPGRTLAPAPPPYAPRPAVGTIRKA